MAYQLVKYVTANSVHPDALTFAGVTGLSFPVTAGHVYTLLAHLDHAANNATNGARFALGGVACTWIIAGSMSVVTKGPATTTMSSGVVVAVDTAIIAQTTSSTTNVPTVIAASFKPSANGTMLIKATCEDADAAGLTVLKGSWARLRETDNR